MRQFTCEATQHTEDLGERLGRIAVPGLYVVLEGDLGAGKTAFARGVGRGLGVTSRVQSPSFILVHLHESTDACHWLMRTCIAWETPKNWRSWGLTTCARPAELRWLSGPIAVPRAFRQTTCEFASTSQNWVA